MSEESRIYGFDVTISAHTNKPFTDGQVPSSDTEINFWCNICQRLIKGVTSSIQHVHGKPHKVNLAKKDATNGNIMGKRGHDLDQSNRTVSAGKEPLAKKTKQNTHQVQAPKTKEDNREIKKEKQEHASEKTNSNTAAKEPVKKAKDKTSEVAEYKCDDCDIVFDTAVNALSHFKGKKHIKKISTIALAKLEEQRKRDREFFEKRSVGRGESGGGRGYGMRRGSNRGIPGNAGIPSSQGDLNNRIGKFLHSDTQTFNYAAPRMNNTSTASYFTSMRGGASNGTLRRDAFDGIGQQDTYGNNTRGVSTNYFGRPGSPLNDSRPSNFGENLPARQSYHNQASPTQPSQLGGSSNGYYSSDYSVNNEIAANQPYGSYY